ncbi:MAG: PAS domain S-box protein, partial [Thermodesulfobacteriota bacterium]
MQELIDLIQNSEDWLIRRILKYAKERDYTRYTSTLEEAWRLSIAGLSSSLIQGIRHYRSIPDFGPDDDFLSDPLNTFGVIEARRHRQRGVSLALFLGLLKYYRQSYADLLEENIRDENRLSRSRLFLERSFDRMEIAFCQEWAGHGTDKLLSEIQEGSRILTNEKNTYLTVFESLTDPSILLNNRHQVINLNHAAVELKNIQLAPGAYYYSTEEFGRPSGKEADQATEEKPRLIGRNITELFPWLAAFMKKFQKTSSGSLSMECTVNTDAVQKVFEVHCTRMLDVSDKVASIILILRDISPRKAMEAELKKSEERYKSLFENNHSAMLLIDPSSAAIVDANPAACGYYGYSHEAMLRMKISDINTLSEEHVFAEMSRAKREKRNQFFFRHRLANGDIRDVEVFSGPIALQNKKLLYSIVHDITGRKEAEAALKRSNQELDDFAYIASHDLREPLRAISNYSTFLMEDHGEELDAAARSKIEAILRLCKREEELISSLLHFSRLGRTDLIRRPVDLNPVVKDIAEILSSTHPEENLRIRIPRPLPTIECDEVRIREIFSNLINNGIKYNTRSKKHIEIAAEKESNHPDAGWILSVTDNGIGIPRKHLSRIFTLFKRLHGRDQYGGGTGAGLTIVKKIV